MVPQLVSLQGLLSPVGQAPSQRSPQPAGPSSSVLVVRTPEELAPFQDSWDDLSRNALEPNVFYESWMFLPALRAFGRDDLQIALVFETSADRRERILCGFFPLQRRRGYRGLPVSCLSLWQHDYCFFSVPLLRAARAGECLKSFLAWMAQDPRGAALLEWPCMPREGRLQQLLVDLCLQNAWLCHVPEQYTRGLLRPRSDAEAYLTAALSARQRKDLRRKEKRLAELGKVELRTLGPCDDLDGWIETFLELEAGGWKGREGTAMASRPTDAEYFRAIARAAFHQGRLRMLGLFLDGRPIAVKCNLLSGEGSFAFKIAFDEGLSQVSPGYQLEVATIRQVHRHPEARWMDSCTDCRPSMFDHLWLDRRVMGTLVLSSGRAPGDLVVSLLPLLRWLKRSWAQLRRRPCPATSSGCS